MSFGWLFLLLFTINVFFMMPHFSSILVLFSFFIFLGFILSLFSFKYFSTLVDSEESDSMNFSSLVWKF